MICNPISQLFNFFYFRKKLKLALLISLHIMKKTVLFLTLLMFLACETEQQSRTIAHGFHTHFGKKPKNIILMIGDGMGLSQITAGMYANDNMLNLERCPIIGLHKCHASNKLITDSAAGATAFACGKKTYNGAIAVDSDGHALPTILEIAESKGWATGMITTSSITHATPACFIAHQEKRSMQQEIAADFLKTDIDLFIGGGKKFFDNRTIDSRNISEELTARNYYVSHFAQEEITELNVLRGKKLAYFTANNQPLPAFQDRNYLVHATRLALSFLPRHSSKGFFLMIESAQIDWGGHANDSEYIITEVLDFDKSIAAVLDFAEQDEETLVVITADHETGGYSIIPNSTPDSLVAAFTTDYHTATMVPVFAFGPSAELFSGVYENTAIFDKMMEAYGFK